MKVTERWRSYPCIITYYRFGLTQAINDGRSLRLIKSIIYVFDLLNTEVVMKKYQAGV